MKRAKRMIQRKPPPRFFALRGDPDDLPKWGQDVARSVLRNELVKSGTLSEKEAEEVGADLYYVYVPDRTNGELQFVRYQYRFLDKHDHDPPFRLTLTAPSKKPPKTSELALDLCVDCNRLLCLRDEYLVRGEIWREAGMDGYRAGHLHAHCLEARLGRKLVFPVDFLMVFAGDMPDGSFVWLAHEDFKSSPEYEAGLA